MIAMKMMRQGESWIGEMKCGVVPRVGEVIYLGDRKAYPVMQVFYELESDGMHTPALLLGDPS